MKRIIYSTILVMSLSLLTAGLVAIPANTASATSGDSKILEVAVCQFSAPPHTPVYVSVTVNGTGSINPSGQGITTGSSIGDQAGSGEAACDAFDKLAQSLGCTTSNCQSGWGISLGCVCQGPHDRLIGVIGALLQFPYTWTPSK